MTELLNVDQLQFTWPGDARPVLAVESLTLAEGEKVFLYGPSGSGKSTLLAVIGGLVRPGAGHLFFRGQDLAAMRGSQRDRFRAEHLGVIFQQFNLLPWLDLHANVMLPCRFSRARARRAGNVRSAAKQLLQAMDLDPSLWSRRADRLSVGQQQRVAAARALIGRPALILADEPTSALDSDRRQAFLELLFAQVEAAGSSLLFVSHDRDLARRFDRAIDLTELNTAGFSA
ncbi:MAG: ABC transporter ATP-binding protein [Wenzhouxiangella sp.]|nr:MAG: ABC transporter ATP-binding protein [Wenzhouxiangella sp.]